MSINRKTLFKLALITNLGDDFYNLVGNRISSPIPPPGWENQTACMVFHIEDGTRPKSGADHTVIFICKFYGGSPSFAAAEACFQAFEDRILTTTKDPDVGIQILNDWDGGADPDLGYPVHMARVQARFSS